MTNAELLAKTKAEIESLKSIEYPCDNSQQATGFFNALDRMTDFLDTLESGKPMNPKELEREIERCLWKLSDDPSNEELRMFARHFAEWGAEHLKK